MNNLQCPQFSNIGVFYFAVVSLSKTKLIFQHTGLMTKETQASRYNDNKFQQKY